MIAVKSTRNGPKAKTEEKKYIRKECDLSVAAAINSSSPSQRVARTILSGRRSAIKECARERGCRHAASAVTAKQTRTRLSTRRLSGNRKDASAHAARSLSREL
eukprot:6191182-Pleurochrysis_carterae.AAC.4